jgi:hypothetical protein
MAGNVIHRGPITRQPMVLGAQVLAGAYLPGTLVTSDGATLTQATAADKSEQVYVLGIRDFFGNETATTAPILTAYLSGDTAVAFIPQVNDIFQIAVGAATYAKGDKLSLGASGRLVATTGVSNVVVAYFDDVAGAKDAGDLVDVVWANFSTTPAA